jgi:hypothetical protein
MKARHLVNTAMNAVLEALGRAFSMKRAADAGHQTSEWECMS